MLGRFLERKSKYLLSFLAFLQRVKLRPCFGTEGIKKKKLNGLVYNLMIYLYTEGVCKVCFLF